MRFSNKVENAVTIRHAENAKGRSTQTEFITHTGSKASRATDGLSYHTGSDRGKRTDEPLSDRLPVRQAGKNSTTPASTDIRSRLFAEDVPIARECFCLECNLRQFVSLLDLLSSRRFRDTRPE